jgi:hypothetical protein
MPAEGADEDNARGLGPAGLQRTLLRQHGRSATRTDAYHSSGCSGAFAALDVVVAARSLQRRRSISGVAGQ